MEIACSGGEREAGLIQLKGFIKLNLFQEPYHEMCRLDRQRYDREVSSGDVRREKSEAGGAKYVVLEPVSPPPPPPPMSSCGRLSPVTPPPLTLTNPYFPPPTATSTPTSSTDVSSLNPPPNPKKFPFFYSQID